LGFLRQEILTRFWIEHLPAGRMEAKQSLEISDGRSFLLAFQIFFTPIGVSRVPSSAPNLFSHPSTQIPAVRPRQPLAVADMRLLRSVSRTTDLDHIAPSPMLLRHVIRINCLAPA
jgi:hypothetical protein